MCHPREAAAYQRTPMGRSLTPVNTEVRASFTRANTKFEVHDARHTVTRNGRRADFTTVWQVGSGAHAAGFLVNISGALFQSPIAHYPAKKLWDVAPGYQALDHIDFNRRITPECLGCHASQQSGKLAPIDCDRCHGDGDAHSLRPSKSNIVHPGKLSSFERASVCEQCHLTGVARIPQPSAKPYEPGRKLEDSVAIFVQPAKDLKVVSHVEQLALARCGPNLWCGSCHNAHGEKVDIDAQCTGCHTERPRGHAVEGCPACHMPKRGAVDGLHTAFTDHRIAKPGPSVPFEPKLRAWRPAANAQRNLGLAELAVGDYANSFRNLTAAYPRHSNDSELIGALGTLLLMRNQHADAAKLLAGHPQKQALAFKALGETAKAAAALERAIERDPLDETSYHLLANLLPARRREILERYLKRNPAHLATREALGLP